MARFTLAIDGILSETELIARLDEAIETARERNDAAKAEDCARQRKDHHTRRDASFDFLMETVAYGEPLTAKLRDVAKADMMRLPELIARSLPTITSPPPGGD